MPASSSLPKPSPNGQHVEEPIEAPIEEPGPAAPINRMAGDEPPASDEFDLESLRVDQSFSDVLQHGEQQEIPVDRPSKEIFIRTHHDVDSYWPTVYCLDLKDHPSYRGLYLLAKSLRAVVLDLFPRNVCAKRLITCLSQYGVLSIWPQTVHDPSKGRENPWTASALRCALEARDQWVRIESDQRAGQYRPRPAAADFGDPQWPDKPMAEILTRAFEQYRIDSLDHPALQALKGAK